MFQKNQIDHREKTKALEGEWATRPPFIDGSIYTYWKTRMRIFLISCDFDWWKVVLDGQIDRKTERGSWGEKAKQAQSFNASAWLFYFLLYMEQNILECPLHFGSRDMRTSQSETEGTSQLKESNISLLT